MKKPYLSYQAGYDNSGNHMALLYIQNGGKRKTTDLVSQLVNIYFFIFSENKIWISEFNFSKSIWNWRFPFVIDARLASFPV